MDAAVDAAARALSCGDPLRALKHVALREDAQALALRATAMAQLGDYARAQQLYRRAAKGFGPRDRLAHARCVVALAEVALAARELKLADVELVRAIQVLKRENDVANARYAQLIRARHALLLGHVDAAEEHLGALTGGVGSVLEALCALTEAEIALRRLQPKQARLSLARATRAAQEARIPALLAEVDATTRSLGEPAARLIVTNTSRLLSLDQVAALLAGRHLIVDACRRVVQQGELRVDLAKRPVLFSLVRRLVEASPAEVTREELLQVAFGMRRPNDSLRARLRVAIGRLRKMLATLAALEATAHGFALLPRKPPGCVIVPPSDDQASSLLALISDGEAWSTSALALALGSSQRSVQRALASLVVEGKVRSLGEGRNRRWLSPPLTLFATHLLLPISSRTP